MTAPAPLGVYVHWPYCARVCPYCDFNVRQDRGRSAEGEALVQAIAADLAGQAARMRDAGAAMALVSVHFGGGTPSLMRPDHVARLIACARALWPSPVAPEITLEANPSDAPRFAALADAGIGRLSLGVQSFDDAELAVLKRNHDAHKAYAALDEALRRFPRVSLDLIYALPGQSLAAWTAALDRTAGLGPEHLSTYQLSVEPGTPFDRARRRGLLRFAGETEGADFYDATLDVLAARGFEAYEVSNFAKGHGARSRHNLVYWRGEAYAGAGPGAHGRLPLGPGRTATVAERNVEAYVERVAATGVGWAEALPLGPQDEREERILLGLRSAEGAPLADLQALGREPRLACLVQDGWLRVREGRMVATRAGRRVLDSLTGALLA